ncbi:hypothetical protein RC54_18580 [Herbaspirillum rubrisubalbicans]|uniref:Uncharacterized protein n=1 Tax=Herbaspirillum rubrisubalbicans TaxID=80842 RepID=A0AAD0U9W5_9BURK|nr:hypothetical protein RC54_18580 [Herbaspirillum rubrisubalbicans]
MMGPLRSIDHLPRYGPPGIDILKMRENIKIFSSTHINSILHAFDAQKSIGCLNKNVKRDIDDTGWWQVGAPVESPRKCLPWYVDEIVSRRARTNGKHIGILRVIPRHP